MTNKPQDISKKESIQNSANKKKLQKCNNTLNKTVTIIFLLSISFGLAEIIMIVLTICTFRADMIVGSIPIVIDVIFKAAFLILAYVATTNHNLKIMIAALFTSAFGFLVFQVLTEDSATTVTSMLSTFNMPITSFLMISAILAAKAVYDYSELEKAPGFPYFNDLYAEREQFKWTDYYEQRYEEITKNSSKDMDDIEL